MLDSRFAEICPLWNKRYENPNDSLYGAKIVNNEILDLGRGECCIAGEAHGFTDAYRYKQPNECNTCYSFSFDIIRACMKGKESKVFEDKINNFTTHFCEVHKV